MTPYYSDAWLTVYAGDCRAVMAEMPERSVHCVVTSPPYWGLRDYGTATWVGGDQACDHLERVGGTGASTLGAASGGNDMSDAARERSTSRSFVPFRDVCGKCGAVRVDGQIGLEPTPEAYVESMVAVFREVRRVLRDDGTVWLNLGDSYAAGTIGRNDDESMPRPKGGHVVGSSSPGRQGTRPRPFGLKPKELVGIPWRVAFALQADGWYLRSDIVWSKPNPMPESVTDRPTKSHEYVFLLSKRERYYFDADAVRERNAINPDWNYGSENYRRDITQDEQKTAGDFRRPKSSGAGWSGFAPAGPSGTGRNLRSVWTIATQPYPGAHFATFPEALVEPCVKAGSPVDGVVLDCFAGSGTTGRVAQRLGRRAVLIDLNPAYLVQAMVRNRDIPLGLGVA
jgi:DNA modification methylase